MASNTGIKLDGKVYFTRSLYIRTKTAERLFVASSYNFEKIHGEFFVSLEDYNASVHDKILHRIVIISGEGSHIPIFRSGVHYDCSAKRTFYSGVHHPPSGMKDTLFAERRIPVVKVISGTYDSAEFERRDTFQDDLKTLSMACLDRERKKSTIKEKKHRSALPSVGAVIVSVGGDTASVTQPPSRRASIVKKPDEKRIKKRKIQFKSA